MSGRGMPAQVTNPPRTQYTDDFYVYPVQVITTNAQNGIVPAQTVTGIVQIQADSAFEWIMSTFQGNESDATFPVSDNEQILVTLQIADSGSARNLMNAPVPINCIAGLGREPFILPVRRIFMARSTVTFTFNNYMPAGQKTFNNIFFNMIGRKIFKIGGDGMPA